MRATRNVACTTGRQAATAPRTRLLIRASIAAMPPQGADHGPEPERGGYRPARPARRRRVRRPARCGGSMRNRGSSEPPAVPRRTGAPAARPRPRPAPPPPQGTAATGILLHRAGDVNIALQLGQLLRELQQELHPVPRPDLAELLDELEQLRRHGHDLAPSAEPRPTPARWVPARRCPTPSSCRRSCAPCRTPTGA